MTCSAKTRPSEQAFVSALKRRHVGWAMRARQRAHRSSFSLLVIVGRPWTVKVGEDGRFGDLLVLRSGQRRQTQRADACPKRSKCGGQKAEEGRRWPKKLRSPARFKNALAHPSPLPLTATVASRGQYMPNCGQHLGLPWYLAGASDCPAKAPRSPVALSAVLSP